MPIQLNHTIVAARDARASAEWYAEMFGFAEPAHLAPFWQVTTANAVNLDFMDHDPEQYGDIEPRHLAFLIGDEDFDRIFGKVLERGIDHYADPHGQEPGQINHHDGGRGVYFPDPDGHWLEIITVPYGGW
jgi:catechol 2,3-dioxygenase-like lactoylglutathione lyase family enzyme